MNEQISDQQINEKGHFTIGGMDTLDLVDQYQTPLFVYDVTKIRNQFRRFAEIFKKNQVPYAISYACKAFGAVGMDQLVNQEGGHLDAVSGGEIYTALKAGFPMEKVTFHGNNKLPSELEMAVDQNVGMIILDNFHEIDLLRKILADRNKDIKVMLRLTLGVTAHTHKYIQTGQVDSKFGFDVQSGEAKKALGEVLAEPQMKMMGFHSHIGSQIFEVTGFEKAARMIMELSADWKKEFDYEPQILNVGGGFGIRYNQSDHPLAPEDFVDAIVKTVKQSSNDLNLSLPEIWIEPGRSIVGPAGYNLYTVGSSKRVPGLKPYVTVDGGMGDNIRPALYDAKYEAALANRPKAKAEEEVHIAGKYCESGDILVPNQRLPKAKPGETLVMFDTGAYGYSMASNYNMNERPAVVFVENGKATEIIRRETMDDLVRLNENFIESNSKE